MDLGCEGSGGRRLEAAAWNRGLPPTCAVEQVYLDDDVRIAKDTSGQYFVYARPV